jgi:hypothetical protein
MEIVNQSKDFIKSENIYKIIDIKNIEENNIDDVEKQKMKIYKYI